jgi:multiple sugar transport system ATP-binding protein
MAHLQLRGLRKSYGEAHVIHGVDLDIQDGEFVVFVGPSGCGKSTLLRCIAGLEDISAGDLEIGGRRVNDVAPAKRDIAMVFQSYALYPHMTCQKNMEFGLKLAGMSNAEIEAAVRRAARILQIEHLLQRRPKDLSGGQRQRVAIGRAIVRKPGVFLFDEPLSNLDAALRVQMRVELAALHRELKATMIYVTHDQVEAMTLASRIVILNAGRIEQVGTPMALYHHPANLFVAGFIGSPKMNFLQVTLESCTPAQASVKLADGTRIRVDADASGQASDAPLTLGVRPEHVAASREPVSNALHAVVEAAEHLGDTTYLYLKAQGAAADLVVRTDPENPLSIGDIAHLGVPAGRCMLFDSAGKALPRTGRS